MSVHATAPSVAYDLLFPWFFFLLPLSIALAAALRTGWWRAARWRRRLVVYAALPIAAALVAGIGLVSWAAATAPPLVTATSTFIHCAPWPAAIAWADVKGVSGQSEKTRYGWKDVGMWVTLQAEAPVPLPPPHPAYGHRLFRIAAALWRGDPTVLLATEARSPANHYCRLTGLDASLSQLYRLAQELVWAHQAIARFYPGQEAALAWCDAVGMLTTPCVTNAVAHHRDCRDRPEPDAYHRCRAAFWARP